MQEDLPIPLKRCDVSVDYEIDPGRKIVVIPQSHDDVLDEKQLIDYKGYRKRFLSWLLNVGKDPESAEGYSAYTVYSTAYRSARFDKWRWEQSGQYSMPPTRDEAESFIEHLAYSNKSTTEKGKLQESMEHYSKWLAHTEGKEEWEFEFNFDGSGANIKPQDFFNKDERRAIRQAALNHGGIPCYTGLTPEERLGWKNYIANVLDKPYDDVSRSDWDEVDGWKVTSLVSTSLDAGLRPDEVSNARTSWVDTENAVLRIPARDSSKNFDNWTVPVQQQTAMYLDRWMDERAMYDYYEDTDRLWLTNHGNPYGSQSLRRLLARLCEQSGIDTENRQISWYTIRHSVGTLATRERDLKAAMIQLRHQNPKTTMKYRQLADEEQRDMLNRMG